MSDDNQVYMDKQDIAIEREVKRTFESARYFEDMKEAFSEEFLRYGICLPLDGYRGNPFIVMIDIDSENETKHKFTLIGSAFKFALEEYKKAVQLEAMNAATGNVHELVEETNE